MRIIFIYSGFLRSWESCKKNHEQNLWSEESEFFFHTYEKPEINREISFLKIPGIFYGVTDHKYNKRRRDETSVDNVLNQWHNMFMAFCAVPKDYDVYVRVRPDILISQKIDFKNYSYGNEIYIPQENDFSGINDRFAFGNYETMKKYYSIYINHPDLWESGVIFHPETMQLANLQSQGINIHRIQITEMIIR